MDLERVIAIHEAGHAVAAIRAGLVFETVSAVPDEAREIDGALYWHTLHEHVEVAMPPGLLAVVLLAGPCAEARLRKLRFDRVFSGEGAIDDRTALAGLGLGDAEFVAASRDAMELIDKDWPVIERVADELQSRETLSFEEVEALVAEQDSLAG